MKTGNLRINQLSDPAYKWYLDYLAAMDAKDVERYASFLAPTCLMIVNNEKPIDGKGAICGVLSKMWKTLPEIEHDLLNIYGNDNCFMLEANNIYKTTGGNFVIRAVALTDRADNGLVTSVRLNMDTTPLRNS
jgi:ketosteroid isomerase-like protein